MNFCASPLEGGVAHTILILLGFARAMAINAPVISGPDPGANPGGSTNFFPALSAEAAWGRLASTDV
jgi:hypothetical protein